MCMCWGGGTTEMERGGGCTGYIQSLKDGTRVTGDYESPDVDVECQTQVLCKSRMHS